MAPTRLTARGALAAALLLALAACGEPSKEDILKKADAIDSKEDLRAELGDPDDIAKVGPLEKWTYEASNGQVTFVITGGNVSLKAATGKSDGDG